MKNYSTFITRKSLNKMIQAHELGLNLGNAIEKNIIDELNSVHLGNEGKFISNLDISTEALSFLDSFITDFKTFEKTGEGSVFAENYINSL